MRRQAAGQHDPGRTASNQSARRTGKRAVLVFRHAYFLIDIIGENLAAFRGLESP
jgi:hypothetical protein